MEPKLIEPDDIRVGDKVRGVRTDVDHAATIEFIVYRITDDTIGSPRSAWDPAEYEWYLLDRPAPSIPVGTLYRNFETGIIYARTLSDAIPWVSLDVDTGYHVLKATEDAAIIADLVPLPVDVHGAGCSPWLWDPVTETAWVRGMGLYLTHVQVGGELIHSGYLEPTGYAEDAEIAARLVPYSERKEK